MQSAKKKIFYLAAATLLTIGLASCGTKEGESTSSSSSNKKTSQVVKNKKTSRKKTAQNQSQSKQTTANDNDGHSQTSQWDATKNKQLATFMANWGVSMGQNYTEHTPENPGKFLGVMIPTDFYTNGKIPLALNTPSNRKPTA